MKLLLDQNLSHRIATAILPRFPGSAHVREHDLTRASDNEIWGFARDRGYTILSKDEDFNQRSLLLGPPPKVVWVRLGNCSTRAVTDLILRSAEDLELFDADPEQSLVVITPAGMLRR